MSQDEEQAMGWLGEGLQGLMSQSQGESEEQLQEALMEQYQFDKMIHDVLATGRGPELMEFLEAHTRKVPLMDLTGAWFYGTAAISSSELAFYRDGQNSVLKYFESAIARARKGPPQTVNSGDEPDGED